MTQIIAIANQKGGVGKTTTSLALAGGLQTKGYKVLLCDLDPQTNATHTYGAKIENECTMYDLLINGDIDCIQHTEMGDIIPGDPLLKDAGKLLDGVSAAFKLKKGLDRIKANYDFIILDTPPALSVLLTNALTAATRIVIPLTPDAYGLQGLMQLMNTINDIKEYTNSTLEVDGLLLVKYKERTHLGKSVMDALPRYGSMLNCKIYKSTIRESIKTREAQVSRKSIFDYAPDSTTAQDYQSFINEFLNEWRAN